MNRRDALFTITGLGGAAALSGCDMDAVRRAEAQLGDRLSRPGTGIQFSGLPEVVRVIVLAQYPATPQQIQVARERARRAAPVVQQRRRAAQSGGGGGGAKKKPAPPAIVAVATTPDERKQGNAQVMLFNTSTGSFVSNQVFDIQSAPSKNDVALVANTTALYVGNGAL